jgi:hypothetical protein
MIKTSKAVLKKTDSGIYLIAALIALMIAYTASSSNEGVNLNLLDGNMGLNRILIS